MFRILACLSLAAMLPGQAVLAAEPVDTVEVSTHDALYTALEQGTDQELMIDGMMASIRAQYAKVPLFAQMELDNPGVLDQVVTAMRPVVKSYSDRVRLDYRPQMVAILREGLSDEEARSLTAFYSSPLGKKILRGTSRNYRPDRVMSTMVDGTAPTSNEVDADMRAMVNATMDEMTPAERTEIGRKVMATPAFARLMLVMPRMSALRVEMEQAPPNAEEQEALDAAIGTVLDRYR